MFDIDSLVWLGLRRRRATFYYIVRFRQSLPDNEAIPSELSTIIVKD